MADSESNSRLDKVLTRIKTVFEILAIPIAAYWAFTHFEQSEAPSLRIRTNVQSELSWIDSPNKDECFGNLDITVKNIGKVNFEVGKATLRVWISSHQRPLSESVEYFSPNNLSVGPPIAEATLPDQLVGEYRPDQAAHENFVFRFRRAPGKYALISLLAPVKPTKYESNPAPIGEYRWDFVCGEAIPPTNSSTNKGG